MAPLRKGGRDLIVAAAIVAILAAALAGAIGSASDRDRSRDASVHGFASDRFGFAASLPDGWSRSAMRLVPLLSPQEVLSVGTGPMPVGGGGNCSREPVAAIARMRPGDALVSVQEYAVTRRMRARMTETYPLLTAYSSADRLNLRRYANVRLGRAPESSGANPRADRYWSATLPFRDDGRVFDALIYLRGPRSADLVGQVVSILSGLEFQQGTYVGGPGWRQGEGASAS